MFIWPNRPRQIDDPVKLEGLTGAWVVQPKWRGKRVEIDCSAEGRITLYSRQGQFLPLNWPWLNGLTLPRPWFLDGELLSDRRIIVWDYAIYGGSYAYRGEYGPRLEALHRVLPIPITQDGQTIACVESVPARYYQVFLGRRGEPHLDGLVWKDQAAKDFWGVMSTREVSSCIKYVFVSDK